MPGGDRRIYQVAEKVDALHLSASGPDMRLRIFCRTQLKCGPRASSQWLQLKILNHFRDEQMLHLGRGTFSATCYNVGHDTAGRSAYAVVDPSG
jgi:hypothetical protein